MGRHSAIQVRQKTEMVKKLMKHHFGTAPKNIQFQPAGLTNFVFQAECKEGAFIVRIGGSGRKFSDYIKEQWAVKKAREKGVPVAEILEVGNEIIGMPYMLQQKLEGEEALHHPKRLKILQEVGYYTRLIHSIPTTGYGAVFDWSNNQLSKNKTWKDYLQDEWKMNTRLQVLKKYSLMNKKHLTKLEHLVERIAKWNIPPSLNHGDIRLKNVIVNDKGKILALIDWEHCTSNIAPYWDLSIALHDLSIDAKQYFLEGYGLDPKEFSRLANAIKVFNILNYTDAIERLVKKNDTNGLEFYRLRLTGALDLYLL